jgi:hypothetical protein
MRTIAVFAAMSIIASPAFAQKKDEAPKPRFGIEVDLDHFPQASAKDALRSFLRAMDEKRVDYAVAQLAEPEFVDKQVKERGTFQKFVDVVRKQWSNDPESIKELRRFLAEGTWEESADVAIVKLKDIPARQVFLKKLGDRWYLEDRKKVKP